MVNILIGAVSGLVSGMGMGGGTILILCLSLFMGVNQHVAQGANLVFFIPTSIVAIITNIKQKLIKWKTALIVARLRGYWSNIPVQKYLLIWILLGLKHILVCFCLLLQE